MPSDHRIREIAAVLDLSWVHGELAPYYSNLARPSIDPALMIRMLILRYVFAVPRFAPFSCAIETEMGTANKIPIVLLPGMDGTGALLTGLVGCLASFRPVLVISFPNDRPLTYDDLTASVLERLPDNRFVLVGESFSGPIAIEIAARQQRVAGLVLAASFARHPMPTLFAPLARMLNLRWVPARLVEAALLGSAERLDLKETLHRVLATLPPEVLRARASEVLRIDKRDRLRAVSCPILCLHARFDRLVSRKRLDEIKSLRPHCEVRTFDAPHMLLETLPAEVASVINDFCKQFA